MRTATIAILGATTVLAVSVPALALVATAAAPHTGPALNTAAVPEGYAPVITAAAASCDGLPAPVLAAQLATESDWNPDAVSPAGAQGLAQFMPATWAAYGADADNDGRASPYDPQDAIWAAARYTCALKGMLTGVPGDETRNTLAAYNAGPYTVIRAGGVPDIPAVNAYVDTIISRTAEYTAPLAPDTDLAGGIPAGAHNLQPNALRGYLLVRQNWGISNIGGYATSGHTKGSDHYTGNAIDIMLLPMGPANTALGWQIAHHFQANAQALGVKYIIWQARSWAPYRADQGWRPYTNPAGNINATYSHHDHIHISFY